VAGSVSPEQDAAVEVVLERSRRLGFLGPGSVRVHMDHGLGYAQGFPSPPHRFLDLGSGGGVPGLVLALHWPVADGVLLDASARRCAFLAEAVVQLGCQSRVRVVRARAEEAGRRTDLRATFAAVVARGFGPPATTAECGAPFLAVGGRLVVSEPPDGGGDELPRETAERWPPGGLAALGLTRGDAWRSRFGYQSLVLQRTCPDRFPRRNGVPAKRPLF
jgi:16S rRNA (guanine527-N7)-methyltransferase